MNTRRLEYINSILEKMELKDKTEEKYIQYCIKALQETITNNSIDDNTDIDVLVPVCESCEIIREIYSLNDKLDITGFEDNFVLYSCISQIQNESISILNEDYIMCDFEYKYDLIISNLSLSYTNDKKYTKQDISSLNINTPYCNLYDADTYILYLVKSLRILTDNGIICFILPEDFLQNTKYNGIRNYIYDKYKIIDIHIDNDKVIFIIQKSDYNHKNNQNNKDNERFTVKINKITYFNTENTIKKLKKLTTDSTCLFKKGFQVKSGYTPKKQCSLNGKEARILYKSNINNCKLDLSINKDKNIIANGITKPVIIMNKMKFDYCIVKDIPNFLVDKNLNYIEYTMKNHIDLEDLIELLYNIALSFRDSRTREFIDIFFKNKKMSNEDIQYIIPIYNGYFM